MSLPNLRELDACKGHVYLPSNVDRIIDALNDVLDDETKMRLVFECPVLQPYLRPTDPTISDPE